MGATANFLDQAAWGGAGGEIDEELARCSRCGRCQSVCPVYLLSGEERLVARGKLALIQAARQGGLEPSAAFVDTISRCLLCGACHNFCARSVPTPELIQQVRAASARALGLPRYYSLLFAGLASPRLLSVASRAGHWLQGLAAALPGAPLSLLPWVGRYAASLRLAARPFLSQALPQGPRPGAVGLFVGCGANYLYPEAARAALGLLEAAGIAVVVPAGQICCGLPAASAGDAASAEELAGRNLAAFQGLEGVVVLCASCAWRLRAIEGLPRVYSLAELLPQALASAPAKLLRVAYHAPCHVRFDGPGQRPLLRLLSELPGVEMLPVEEACCGSGGLFSLSQPELSQAILRERLRGLLALRPDVVATDCTGCLIQLAAGLQAAGRSIPVVHPAQLLAGQT